MASIIVISGAQRGHCVEVGESAAVTVGRGGDCTLALDDDRASRCHLELGWDAGSESYYAKDLNSRNGVTIGDKRIDEVQLRDGDVLLVGDTRLMFTHRSFPDRGSALAYCDGHRGDSGPTIDARKRSEEPWRNA